MTPCARCVTPAKCGIHGCCPGTWPAEATAAKTAAERKADERRRHSEAGRVAVTHYIYPEDREKVARYIKRLLDRAEQRRRG